MGFLKKIIKKIIFLAFIIAFFMFGGFEFIKDKYDAYTTPEREVLIKEEKDYGILDNVSPDYTFSRTLNFFGYRKLNVYYVPKKQKITVLDLNSDNILTENDFMEGKLEEKLENFFSKFASSTAFPLSNIQIIEKGKIVSGIKQVPYVNFEADLKFFPLIKTKGTIAIYTSKNRENIINKIKKDSKITSKLVISSKTFSKYEDSITKKFISQIGF